MGGSFANGVWGKLSSVFLSALVIGVNIYFVMSYVKNFTNPWEIAAAAMIGPAYLTFCLYLSIDMAAQMSWMPQSVRNSRLFVKMFKPADFESIPDTNDQDQN